MLRSFCWCVRMCAQQWKMTAIIVFIVAVRWSMSLLEPSDNLSTCSGGYFDYRVISSWCTRAAVGQKIIVYLFRDFEFKDFCWRLEYCFFWLLFCVNERKIKKVKKKENKIFKKLTICFQT